LVRLICAEFKKLKGSNILLICIAGCCILPFMAVFINKSVSLQKNWVDYCTQSLWLSILLFWPCVFGLIGTYIFTREQIENTYKNLLIIPVGRIRLVIAKLTVLFTLIIGMTVLSYFLNLIGLFAGINIQPGEFMEGLFTYTMVGVLMFIAILPIILVTIVSRKGYLISCCVTIVYAIVSFIGIWSSVLSSILPIIVIMRICNITSLNLEYAFSMEVSYISIFMIGIVALIGMFTVAKTQDA